MRSAIVIFILLVIAVRAGAETPGVASRLDAAHAAYDRGDFNEAQSLYEESLRELGASSELFYNTGNAAFRRDFPGQAILFYRRAWYLDPRDADIRANMDLARQKTGAVFPAFNLIQKAVFELSQREWTRVFTISFWTAFVFTALSIVIPAARRFTNLPAGVAAIATVIALTGWLHWRYWQQEAEVVVIRTGETARYEPRLQSTPHFSTPEGSVLIREEIFDNWVKVRDGSKSGWLPKDAIEQVYPWQLDRK